MSSKARLKQPKLEPLEKLGELDRLAFREKTLVAENVMLRQEINALRITLAQMDKVSLERESQQATEQYTAAQRRVSGMLSDRGQDPADYNLDLATGLLTKKALAP